MSDMFAETIAAHLPELQDAAEALMTSTVHITRLDPDGEPGWDEETGEYTDPLLTVYEGPCKVQTYEAFESNADAGGAQRVLQRYYMHVPVAAGPFLSGDRAEIVRSPSHLLLGNVYIVAGPHEKNWQTAQRLLVDLDSGPS